ncbi:hypothetical protein V2G26_019586 [Clonostachys chloroleuca]
MGLSKIFQNASTKFDLIRPRLDKVVPESPPATTLSPILLIPLPCRIFRIEFTGSVLSQVDLMKSPTRRTCLDVAIIKLHARSFRLPNCSIAGIEGSQTA